MHPTGTVKTSMGSSSAANAIALQSDGKIIAGGVTYTSDLEGDFSLVRYLGDPDCLVPSLKAKRLAAARRAILRAYCSLGYVKRRFSATVKRGRVISQHPKAHLRRPPGWKVNVVISKGQQHRPR